LARKSGLSEEAIKHADDDWFKPEVLRVAQKYLYIRPVVEKTVNYYGPGRNFVLTSRNPYLKQSTIDYYADEFPKIRSENILIREDGGIDMAHSAGFKVKNLKALAEIAPWVVFVDDSTDFTKAVIDANIPNCLVINIPLGKTMPDFRHERLIVIKRYPEYLQAMYPLMFMVDRAINGRTSLK